SAGDREVAANSCDSTADHIGARRRRYHPARDAPDGAGAQRPGADRRSGLTRHHTRATGRAPPRGEASRPIGATDPHEPGGAVGPAVVHRHRPAPTDLRPAGRRCGPSRGRRPPAAQLPGDGRACRLEPRAAPEAEALRGRAAMRRLGLLVALAAVAAVVAPAVASADTITPLCTVGQGPTQPCGGGWYTSPVFLSWTWSPLTSGTGSCQAGPYDTDATARVSCTVTWTDGFVGTQSYTIKVETSSPTATVAPSRPPDSGGWYNGAVTGAASATAFSGIASC